jgi:DNA-binding CsgD family transcriptional regulator
MTERARNRARERLAALATADLGAEEARRAAIETLRGAVGFERWCWPLTDPASALSTSGIAEFDLWSEVPRLAVLEEHGDVTSKPRLAVGPQAAVALSAATGGKLARSKRWRECLRPYGVGDELMTVCRDRHGCWGSVELMRDSCDRPFDDEDVQLLETLAPVLGTLLRRSQRRSRHAGRGEAPPLVPATLILDRDLDPMSWTSSFGAWLAELSPEGMLPPAVYELGARIGTPRSEASGLPARVRIRTSAGRWATLEGAPLEGEHSGHVVITIRESTPDEILDLLCRTYDLTRRERELVVLVLEGLATKQLAHAMSISPYTVQDHLKAIFGKAGVRSRRELISQLGGRLPAVSGT